MDTILKQLGALAEFFNATRLGALADKSAWLLMAPAIAALYVIDPAMVMTLLQWTLFGSVLAGAAVMISRIVFPQIKLTELVKDAQDENNTAAGLIVAAVVLFVGILILALVIWAKA